MIGRPWKETIRWIFIEELKFKKTYRWDGGFINGIWIAWKSIRRGLIRRPPECGVELSRQPLTWNKLFVGNDGCLLGERPWLAWGQMADGPGQSFGSWLDFVSYSRETQKTVLAGLRGSRTMAAEINHSIANCRLSYTISNSCTRWFELSLNGLDRYVIGANADGTHCWFDMDDNGQLCGIVTPLENPLEPKL